LGIEVFDRSSLPIVPTQKGNLILEKAKSVVKQAHELESFAKELAKSAKNSELVY
jgi:DNA-binding transcriptional LysR family regulator